MAKTLGLEIENFIQDPNFFFGGGLFRATPVAYRDSQARGWIKAVAAVLHHSHSNTGSKPHLWPKQQLRAMAGP